MRLYFFPQCWRPIKSKVCRPVWVCMCLYLRLRVLYTVYPYVCVLRTKKKSGVGSRRTFRRQWWWQMTSRWRLSRSCGHSGGSCRRNRIAAQSSRQTSKPCRVSGTIPTILFFLFLSFSKLHQSPTSRLTAVPFSLNIISTWDTCQSLAISPSTGFNMWHKQSFIIILTLKSLLLKRFPKVRPVVKAG